MSLQPLMHRQPPQGVIIPYGWMAKILKIPVFRLALGNDLVSRTIISIHNFFSRLCQGQSRSFRSFDPAIAQKSVDRFVALGAKTHFVVPRDGRGEIQMMTFQAQDLEQKIQALGGSWERRLIQESQVFAIVPPEHKGADWLDFKEKLSHFHWREEEGMLITCDCADAIPPNAAKQCFLYAHSTSSSFASDWKRAGFYIGAKQDLCFFDNGNTWKNSGRPPSEESFYLEIEAVYNKIKDGYPIDCLWVGGSCGGAPVAAYLKRLLHDQGINFFAEQSFPDLDDFVRPISPFFAPRVKGSLSDQALLENMEHRPPACQFGAAKLWEDLPRYEGPRKGKFILVQVRDDEHIKPEAYERYLDLANRINKGLKFYDIEIAEVIEHKMYDKKGRPKTGDSYQLAYEIKGIATEKEGKFEAKAQAGSCYVLATTIAKEELEDQEVIEAYKQQSNSVEKGFRFLKDPFFFTSSLFIKKIERIMGLLMVMTLALLVYSIAQRRLRAYLKEYQRTLPNQIKQAIANPTLRWIFQLLEGIEIVTVRIGEKIHETISGLNDQRKDILKCFSPTIQEIYRIAI